MWRSLQAQARALQCTTGPFPNPTCHPPPLVCVSSVCPCRPPFTDAAASALDGEDATRRWLQTHAVAPLRRAVAAQGGRGSAASVAIARLSGAGYCHRTLLLYGPPGAGKTEAVHAIAQAAGACLLYVPGGDLLRGACAPDDGQRLLRALLTVAWLAGPCVVCFDDAHRSFPADGRADAPGHALARLRAELGAQMQRLAAADAALAARASSTSAPTPAARGTSGPAAKRPAWGQLFGGRSKGGASSSSDASQDSTAAAAVLPAAYSGLAGPLLLVFATRHPEALDPWLQSQLHTRLLLDLPDRAAREEQLLSWAVSHDAALGVIDVEALLDATEGFSCADIKHLCQEAALRPVQEVGGRAGPPSAAVCQAHPPPTTKTCTCNLLLHAPLAVCCTLLPCHVLCCVAPTHPAIHPPTPFVRVAGHTRSVCPRLCGCAVESGAVCAFGTTRSAALLDIG